MFPSHQCLGGHRNRDRFSLAPRELWFPSHQCLGGHRNGTRALCRAPWRESPGRERSRKKQPLRSRNLLPSRKKKHKPSQLQGFSSASAPRLLYATTALDERRRRCRQRQQNAGGLGRRVDRDFPSACEKDLCGSPRPKHGGFQAGQSASMAGISNSPRYVAVFASFQMASCATSESICAWDRTRP